MKILVTGGAGFIGSHLTRALMGRGDSVVCIDNFNDYYDPATKRANVEPFLGNPAYTLVEGDIRDSRTVQRIFAENRIDCVAHLAAMAGVRASMTQAPLYVDVNINGTLNLLEAARDHEVGLFVFASTSSVYGSSTPVPFREDAVADRPLAAYPATKRSCELLGHTYHHLGGMNFTALRFFNVYGPGGRPDMMPYKVMYAISHDLPITLFEGGRMQRDWTYIDDIILGVLAAIDRPMGYEVINLGFGSPLPMTEFIEIIEHLAGSRARVKVTPAPPSDPPITYCDNSKARRLLDFHPSTPIHEGLERTWAWFVEAVLNG